MLQSDVWAGASADDGAYGVSNVRGHCAFVCGDFICAVGHVAPGDSCREFERWTAVVSLDLIAMVIILILIVACARLLVIVSSDTLRLKTARAARLAAVLFASPLVVVVATVLLAGNRAPAFAEIVRGLILGGALVGSVLPVGRLIGHLRRPYDAWLALDLAA